MGAHGSGDRIRTPDQRLRIFVSSTLRELESERRAVRASIERLRLAPVMFELGARPHPPRDLYRAYLDQSDVFVGVYGERYGWIAPGEEISGLEDEYRLAPRAMPKLIYVLDTDGRDERLDGLIARIQDDDTASYKSFSSTVELAELVEADLATLLAERFDASRADAGAESRPAALAEPARVPSPFTRLIGRDDDVSTVLAMLADPGRRLVTILGPGGMGKSRLAIAVAEAAGEAFPDGAVFVALENVLEPELLLPTIGYAVGIRDTGELPIEERLATALAGRRMLVVLDNVEQLVDAAHRIVQLYSLAPDAAFLVTSRVVLRIRGERVYELSPLRTHDPASPESVARARTSPAVELFVERARSVKPDFEVTDANAAAVVGICRMLEGLPLAIELAAARMRVLTPEAILRRLDRQLPLLVDSSRDLPERQRTLRSTIEWSTGLLPDDARRMLRELAVFSPGFALDSVDAFAADRGWDFDTLDALETLVDSSLVDQRDVDGDSVFSLLVTVREHGIEQLRAEGSEQEVRDAHARVYRALALAHADALGDGRQLAAVARLNLERGNLRSAVRHLVQVGDADAAADVAWRLFVYWWVGGYLLEAAVWMGELRQRADGTASERSTAIADFYLSWRDMWVSPSAELPRILISASERFARADDELGTAMTIATAGLAEATTAEPDIAQAAAWLTEGARRFGAVGAGWGQSLAYVALGRIALLTGRRDDARDLFRRAVEASLAGGDTFTSTVATHHLARVSLLAGELEASERLFASALDSSSSLGHEEGIAYAAEGICAISAARGDLERAAVLAGAAAAIRKRTAVYDAEPFVFHLGYLDAAVSSDADRERVRTAFARGQEYGAAETAVYALTGGTGAPGA